MSGGGDGESFKSSGVNSYEAFPVTGFTVPPPPPKGRTIRVMKKEDFNLGQHQSTRGVDAQAPAPAQAQAPAQAPAPAQAQNTQAPTQAQNAQAQARDQAQAQAQAQPQATNQNNQNQEVVKNQGKLPDPQKKQTLKLSDKKKRNAKNKLEEASSSAHHGKDKGMKAKKGKKKQFADKRTR